MNIIKAKNIGFCNGVNYTIKKTIELLNEYDELYCLGKIVHNKDVIKYLENKNLIFIENIEEAKEKSNVIIRAHGESLSTYEKAKEKNINLIDLTCGKVKIIHKKVNEYSKDHFIIILGKKTHPEIKGTISYAGKNSTIIEKIDEIDECIKKIKKSNTKKVYICAQTTFNSLLFKEITNKIIKKLKSYEVIINNTLCDSTEKRQEEIRKLSRIADTVVIIGDKLSSNTKELYNISKKICEYTYMIENECEIHIINKNVNNIVIASGASTSLETVEKVIKLLDS